MARQSCGMKDLWADRHFANVKTIVHHSITLPLKKRITYCTPRTSAEASFRILIRDRLRAVFFCF